MEKINLPGIKWTNYDELLKQYDKDFALAKSLDSTITELEFITLHVLPQYEKFLEKPRSFLPQTVAYKRFVDFLNKRKNELEAKPETKPQSMNPINEFEYLEKLICDPFESLDIGKTYNENNKVKQYIIGGVLDKDGHKYNFYTNSFQEEIHRVENAIINHTYKVPIIELPDYVNKVYPQIDALIEKNLEQIKFYDELYPVVDPEHVPRNKNWLLHSMYGVYLSIFKDSFRKKFRHNINPDLYYNTDSEKYEQNILRCFYWLQGEIKRHKPECETKKKEIKRTEEQFYKYKKEYHEIYKYLVRNWIESNKVIGKAFTVIDFTTYQLDKINNLFEPDRINKTYSATDYLGTTYTFDEEFYQKYVAKIFDFIKDYLQDRLKELSNEDLSLDAPFPFVEQTTLEEMKAIAVNYLKFFSGSFLNKKIMNDADYKRMLEYTYILIETDKIPPKIKQVNTKLPVTHIRYTFYLLHKKNYGNRQIHDSWINFLHAVFKQFENTATSTTKKKFSEEPGSYQKDTEQK